MLKYLIDEVGMSLNRTEKQKSPLEFIFPPEKEHDETLFKKWKPVYEVRVQKPAIEFLNRQCEDFQKSPDSELIWLRFNDAKREVPEDQVFKVPYDD